MSTAPFRSVEEMVKLSMRSGERQMMEKATQSAPAARRRMSIKIQVPMRRLDGILAVVVVGEDYT
jgi:hypothetical protein